MSSSFFHSGALLVYQESNPMVRLFGSIFRSLQDASTRALYGKEQVSSAMSFYTLIDRDMSGKVVEMSKYEGNVLLLVNVASK